MSQELNWETSRIDSLQLLFWVKLRIVLNTNKRGFSRSIYSILQSKKRWLQKLLPIYKRISWFYKMRNLSLSKILPAVSEINGSMQSRYTFLFFKNKLFSEMSKNPSTKSKELCCFLYECTVWIVYTFRKLCFERWWDWYELFSTSYINSSKYNPEKSYQADHIVM